VLTRTILGGLAVLGAAAGCAAGAVEGNAPTANVIVATVSTDWSATQQGWIVDGIDFWNGELDLTSTVIDIRAGDCRVGQRGCIHPVAFENRLLRDYDDPEDPATVVGHCYFDTIVIWEGLEGETLELLSAHEFGHFLGLEHEETGIMAPVSGEMSFTLGKAAEVGVARGG
jgi:hypothetical protein